MRITRLLHIVLVLQSKELPDSPNPVKRRLVGYSNQWLARAGQNITASSIPNSEFREKSESAREHY